MLGDAIASNKSSTEKANPPAPSIGHLETFSNKPNQTKPDQSSKGMAVAFLLLPSLGDCGLVPSLAIITAGYGLTGHNTKMLFDL